MRDYFSEENYDHIKKALIDDSVSNSSKSYIITSLDDVFSNFETLIRSHPYYVNKNVFVKDYLKENFKDYLDTAVSDGDIYKIREVSSKVGKIFSPKTYNYFKRKKEELAFNSAFNDLMKLYLLFKV